MPNFEKIRNELMSESRFRAWYQTATPEEQELSNRVYDLGDQLFGDMLFWKGSITHDYVACQAKDRDGEWENITMDLPPALDLFSYSYFTYHVADLGVAAGGFNEEAFSLTVAPDHANDDVVILHEMIHLHEFVLEILPMYFHDAVLFCLYKDLQNKIDDLDQRIEAHGHILNSSSIANIGGTHDILFLLKSFDLDLKNGYKLGTVFGYGMANE